ncbi:MAG: flavin reductase family protein [Deltaproteobacteria bacterium]|nr:flavin reductase family protein [Deltaproteobacteria bacterium]
MPWQSLGAVPLAFPAPAWVIGTYDHEGKPNVMTAAWGGICCSKPPCLSMSLRKATYTYSNLVERRAFTVNVPSADFVKETDFFGMASGKNTDKLSATALTPVKSSLVDAPCVEQFPMVIECSLLHSLEIGLHTLFVGEIKDVKVKKDVLSPSGTLDMKKAAPLVFAPVARFYHTVGPALGPAFSLGKEFMK